MKESGDHDRRLVHRFLKQRDEATFRDLYDSHTPRMYLLALRLVAGSAADADDILQNAWIRAASALPRFEWRSSLHTWLCGIVVHCAQEQARASRRSETLDSVDWKRSLPQPNEEQIDLERAIASLPDGYRQVLILHDLEGFTHEEIAELLKIEAGTSKSQLFRARRAARDLLDSRQLQ